MLIYHPAPSPLFYGVWSSKPALTWSPALDYDSMIKKKTNDTELTISACLNGDIVFKIMHIKVALTPNNYTWHKLCPHIYQLS